MGQDQVTHFKTRTLDQEPDAIVRLVEHPNYVVIGTYSLIKNEGDGSHNASDTRKGSLQLSPFSSTPLQRNTIPNVHLDRLDFPFGIYAIDTCSHPSAHGMLGVATSNAEVLFFTVIASQNSNGQLTALDFSYRGKAVIEEPEEGTGRLATITALSFVLVLGTNTDGLCILLAATTQLGHTKLVKVKLQVSTEELENKPTRYFETPSQTPDCQVLTIHTQSNSIEAWTVSHVRSTARGFFLISGGDDNQLLVSSIDLGKAIGPDTAALQDFDLHFVDSMRIAANKKSHNAGIVSILALAKAPSSLTSSVQSPTNASDRSDPLACSYLLLTGSYDETLRLFHFIPTQSSSQTQRVIELLQDIKLGGGVWRIHLLRRYVKDSVINYILLVACHTAGVYILRLTCSRAQDDTLKFEFKVEKRFAEGHESLVYAVEAREKMGPSGKANDHTGIWEVLSTSFYDKKMCNWEWKDEIGPLQEGPEGARG